MPAHRYARAASPTVPAPGSRSWVDHAVDRAPLWASVDLRDGNQALANPMDLPRKQAMFDLLLGMGFKDVEVGYPSASEAEFDFVRHLVTADRIPDDVTISVFTPARPELIDRTFEAVRGADRAIVHLCHATACLWREVVFRMSPAEVIALARDGAERMVRLAERAECDVRFEYSPETFNVTEPEFALEIANTVAGIVDASPDRPLTLNLPSTVEVHTPNVYADQIEWMHRNLDRRGSIILSVHPHNDRGTAVAAAEFAIAAGADRVEGTLFGNGERTGNVCLVTLALNLFSRGIDPQLDISDVAAVRAQVEECNQMAVHPRHPYGGDLVFTAFSGTHQDAVSKGLAKLADDAEAAGVTPAELPWDVPYLPVDPQDLGRSYEAIIRVNSQSGKGGIAHVLHAGWGLDLPTALRVEFAKVVQRFTDLTGAEMEPERIWDVFRTEYCDGGSHPVPAPRADDGRGDPVESLVHALADRGVSAGVDEVVEAAVGRPAGTTTGTPSAGTLPAGTAVCYARVLVEHRPVWGVGLAGTAAEARTAAVRAAVHRSGALVGSGAGGSGAAVPVGSREATR